MAGPPDVEQPCEPSLQAWSPELSLYDTNVTSPCPDTEGCTLTLRFLRPVVPHALTLWVTYISASKRHTFSSCWFVSGMETLKVSSGALGYETCARLNVVVEAQVFAPPSEHCD